LSGVLWVLAALTEVLVFLAGSLWAALWDVLAALWDVLAALWDVLAGIGWVLAALWSVLAALWDTRRVLAARLLGPPPGSLPTVLCFIIGGALSRCRPAACHVHVHCHDRDQQDNNRNYDCGHMGLKEAFAFGVGWHLCLPDGRYVCRRGG